MKLRISASLLFVFLLLGNSNRAYAQFWEKLFGGGNNHRRSVQRRPPPAKPKGNTANTKKPEPKKPPVKKKQEVEYPVTVMKQRYRVDVLAPLYLDELVKGDKVVYKDKVPDKAISAVEFCEGVKIAADTLNDLYSLDVYIHDITDVTESTETLINAGKLDSSDLIIGAIQSKEIPIVAKFAKKHQINFISAVSPSDGGVKDNPYFTLVQPSLQTHCESIMGVMAKKHADEKPFLFYRTNVPVDASAYGYFTNSDSTREFKKISCNVMPTQQELAVKLDANKTNVIVVTVLDNAFADALLTDLYTWFPNYRFEVYGMPSWKSLATLHKPDAYPNVAVNITAPNYFDATMPNVQYVDGIYKTNYGGRPGELVYKGYEALYWYATLLSKYGTIYNKNVKDNGQAPFTKFDIKPKWDRSLDFLYNENRHIYLFTYQSGSYIVSQP
jgi:hypothetical protein